ncbi:hypothetical protein [Gimesia fumaroli]|uniref:Endonuclease/exonuclease/phosphatase domain-containing protein n=1 Tax=Gimesia fumaroli TaxID=2527976 RepID=A0A518I6Z1_9PLAN|nr:hypothetical protein [Gimesia fumaroli]QDV48861.1 hypothetical protein Enr17x_08750 [Gimesia fumaroli]
MNQDDHIPSAGRLTKIIAYLIAGLSLVLLIGLSLSFAFPFDACVAITVYPAWVWFTGGLFLSLILFKTKNRWVALTTIGLWFVFLVGFADTPLSLWRGLWGSSNSEWVAAREQERALRVITINCSGRQQSILALKQKNPDLILIQESPTIENLKTVANELFGGETHLLAGVDASILCRGEIEPITTTVNWSLGKLTLPSGQKLVVVSLRLSPPPFRLDLWNPACWRDFRDHRIKQRAELAALSQALTEIPASLPLIVGGRLQRQPPGSNLPGTAGVATGCFFNRRCGLGKYDHE